MEKLESHIVSHLPDPLTEVSSKESPKTDEEYSKILRQFNIEFINSGYYLRIGNTDAEDGWVIHLSVIISQLDHLFNLVIPFLKENKVSFEIPIDKETTSNLLSGFFGVGKLGKIISIYPENSYLAALLVPQLVNLTRQFKGPNIPTAYCIGGIVFTQYDSFTSNILDRRKSADINGFQAENYNKIPFTIPTGITWPFNEICKLETEKSKLILKNIYRPLFFLKEDVRGNVFKGIYLKNWFKTNKCVIKQGYKNMASDDWSRTIHDRLAWQYKLHRSLIKTVPVPTAFDFFIEDENTYLILEYINGKSLLQILRELNIDSRSWFSVSSDAKSLILNLLLKITKIINALHNCGLVHRDIVPVNFMIDRSNKIYLIDLELAYSLKDSEPYPAFLYGTNGFMSPQQMNCDSPAYTDDIYSIGALLLMSLVGLSPMKFLTNKNNQLSKQLDYFLQNKKMSETITRCLNFEPKKRPSLDEIELQLKILEKENAKINNETEIKINISKSDILSLVNKSLLGLSASPIVMLNDQWYSKTQKTIESETPRNKEYTRYIGVYEGLSGILYLIARAGKAGYQIKNCKIAYNKSWEFITDFISNNSNDLSPGLYHGSYGIALAISEGIKANLLDDTVENRKFIEYCVNIKSNNLSFSDGNAGRGIVMMQCKEYINIISYKSSLEEIVRELIERQDQDGSWDKLFHQNSNQSNKFSFGYGIPGILYFLLEYYSHYKDAAVKKTIDLSVSHLLTKTNNLKSLFEYTKFNKLTQGNIIGDERKGLILTFIKAFDLFQNVHYKEIAEQALRNYPTYIVKNDFSQSIGLSGLGELYLEAASVFNTPEWYDRASWLAGIFKNSICETHVDTGGYWQMEETNLPTADFMTGNSGIIHFLIRCIDPSKVGYRLIHK